MKIKAEKAKAAQLKEIFWDMNCLSVCEEERIFQSGKREVIMKILVVETIAMSAEEAADYYLFSQQQREALEELLAPENEKMWDLIDYLRCKKALGAYCNDNSVML